MASRARSLKLPPDLSEVAELRAKALGYPSLNAYLCGLIRYDALVQGPHSITLPIAQQRPEQRDCYDAKLLELSKRGVGERGQLLKRIVEGTTKI
jgi:hypothetical protein